MKKILLALAFASTSLVAQTVVSTTPQNKKVLLEEFTGTGCPNCPGGHTMAANILAANPGNVFVVAHHPIGSNYTTNDPMKHAFPSAFYAMPYISSTSRFMPSATLSRRSWDANGRISGVADWTSRTNTIKAESAPVNVGVIATYNSANKILTVTVEAYFTSSVTANTTINAFLTQDGITATQSGGSGGSSYVHNHVFREAFTAQWGNAISTPTTSGSFKTYTYTFDNSSKNYDMTKCEVVAFVRNASNEEVLNTNGASVSMSTGVASINSTSNNIAIFPNPINENSIINLNLVEQADVNYSIINVIGQKVIQENMGSLSAGNHTISIGNKAILSKGIYFVNVTIGEDNFIEKIVVE